jgi:hypothetical protein
MLTKINPPLITSSTSAPIANLVVDLPGMLAKIHAEQLSQRLMFFNLNPFAQNSAIVEDALGWKFSIPLELISSWNVSMRETCRACLSLTTYRPSTLSSLIDFRIDQVTTSSGTVAMQYETTLADWTSVRTSPSPTCSVLVKRSTCAWSTSPGMRT